MLDYGGGGINKSGRWGGGLIIAFFSSDSHKLGKE